MAYIRTPFITSKNKKTYVVSDLLGKKLKNKLQKRIKVDPICLGKPLDCHDYKD